ncbi:MAG: AAA family ATPase, partial [bacterium]|nr:AAA family ATPase [bacterium]
MVEPRPKRQNDSPSEYPILKKIIEGNYYYVDKSLFIKEVLDRGDTTLLIPRPRRFGKTINLSMLNYFYDCCPSTDHPGSNTETGSSSGNKKLFDSLAISEAGDAYMKQLGKHPVIFFSLKDIKEKNWEICLDKMKQLIQKEFLKHRYLLDSPAL